MAPMDGKGLPGIGTRRRFLGSAALGAAAFTIAGRVDTASAANFQVHVNSRDISSSPQGPTALASTAWETYEQTRDGRTRGDAVWVIRDHSELDPYKDQTYFTDNGALLTGRYIVVSQKRRSAMGGDPANGAIIQGISSVPDGSEPSMISASADVDGPAIAAEAFTTNAAGQKNQSAFAAYDLNSVSGGQTPYSGGYGRKKFIIRGDGGLWWGTDLKLDPWANSDARLERQAPGALVLSAPRTQDQARLVINSLDSSAALQFAQNSVRGAEFVLNQWGHLYLDVGSGTPFRMYKDWSGVSIGDHDINRFRAPTVVIQALRTSLGALEMRMFNAPMTADMARVTDYDANTVYSGVDRNGAFFDFVKSDAAGPPASGTWNTGSCVLNTKDSRMYWCVNSGSPGSWKSAQLT
jgi:hypothetical protein